MLTRDNCRNYSAITNRILNLYTYLSSRLEDKAMTFVPTLVIYFKHVRISVYELVNLKRKFG